METMNAQVTLEPRKYLLSSVTASKLPLFLHSLQDRDSFKLN